MAKTKTTKKAAEAPATFQDEFAAKLAEQRKKADEHTAKESTGFDADKHRLAAIKSRLESQKGVVFEGEGKDNHPRISAVVRPIKRTASRVGRFFKSIGHGIANGFRKVGQGIKSFFVRVRNFILGQPVPVAPKYDANALARYDDEKTGYRRAGAAQKGVLDQLAKDQAEHNAKQPGLFRRAWNRIKSAWSSFKGLFSRSKKAAEDTKAEESKTAETTAPVVKKASSSPALVKVSQSSAKAEKVAESSTETKKAAEASEETKKDSEFAQVKADLKKSAEELNKNEKLQKIVKGSEKAAEGSTETSKEEHKAETKAKNADEVAKTEETVRQITEELGNDPEVVEKVKEKIAEGSAKKGVSVPETATNPGNNPTSMFNAPSTSNKTAEDKAATQDNRWFYQRWADNAKDYAAEKVGNFLFGGGMGF